MSSDGEDESFYDAKASGEDEIGDGEAKANQSEGHVKAQAMTSGLEGWAGEGKRVSLNSDALLLRQPPVRTPRENWTHNTLRARSSDARSHRISLPLPGASPVPDVPERFLSDTRSPIRHPPVSRRSHGIAVAKSATSAQENTRRKSLSALPAQVHQKTLQQLESAPADMMTRGGRGGNEDLFLELANDREDRVRPPSRLSFSAKRRSLPAESGLVSSAERRPKSSGNAFAARPSSRLDPLPTDFQRHVDRYRSTPSRASFQADDAVSLSGRSRSGRPLHFSAAPDRSPMSPSVFAEHLRSPELPQYGRRRPSFGTNSSQPAKTRPSQLSSKPEYSPSESPPDSSEPKHSNPDSTSVESQSADTVWDELDDLKSRIKKLELTGTLLPTSGAAVSAETKERPRTATTAPTTIDSSPKHEKQEKKPEPDASPAESPAENAVGGPNTSNIHPLLHSALAKAKPLLNPSLYRPLEATAADALQLVAMTGSAGPQGTAFSAASIINGVTVSDRHVRRKADTMCRNLTDLCLALCEGKHEAPSVRSSPVTLDTPVKSSPTLRYARSSLGQNDDLNRGGSRPMSRLEARRTSILGSQASSGLGQSPRESGEEMSASEQESTPSHPNAAPPKRFGSRLQVARAPRYDDASGDEDPTIRPLSRARTDVSRAKPGGPRDYNSPQQQRSPSLRDSLVVRQANARAHESTQTLSRVSSLNSDAGGRRRFLDPSTPSVREEESSEPEYQPVSQSKRRVTSFGPSYGSRRATADLPSRASSLTQRRHVVVE